MPELTAAPDAAPRVTGIFIYPLKGAAGIALAAAELDGLGFRDDRRWMIVDGNRQFVSQRTMPRLALIRPALEHGELVLRAPGHEPLTLPRAESALARKDPASVAGRTVRVWNDDVTADDAGAAADAWITAFLGSPAHLVRLAADTVRPVDPRFARRPTDRVAFVDGYPCLLISQGSLDGLNRRLPQPVPMNRFRPNLVVAPTTPHAEDGWRRIRVGTATFDVVKPCGRCVVTTVDQDRGIAGEEPLRTLATYRKVGSKVNFGQNLIHQAPARLAVGDVVEVLETA